MMRELPSGWARAQISDVTDSFQTVDPRQFPDQHFRYIDIGSIDNQTQKVSTHKEFLGKDAPSRARRLTKSGDVLFSTVRTHLKNVAIVPQNLDGALTSTGIALLRPNEAMATSYLFNWLRSDSFISLISESQDGTLYPAVKDRDIFNAEIFVPPTAEQKRIIAKVDRLTSRTEQARSNLNQVLSLCEKYKTRVVELGCSGALTYEWRVSNDLHNPREVRLRDVAHGFNYGTSSKSSSEGDVPVLRMGNIQNGKLDWSSLVYTSDSSEIEKYDLKDGDVLFNRTNSPELVGKTAVFKGERKAIFAGYLIRVKCGSELLPDFLAYALNGPSGRQYSQRVKSDGVSQSNINAKKLANFKFLLPTLEEQREIVLRIESAFAWVDFILAEHGAVSELLPKLDSAILAKAFSGQLVSQVQSEEPALKTLERIKASKESEETASTRPLKSPNRAKRKLRMANLTEVLRSAGKWLSASEAAKELGITNGSDSDAIEEFYSDLRSKVFEGRIEVERRGDEDWLRFQSAEVDS